MCLVAQGVSLKENRTGMRYVCLKEDKEENGSGVKRGITKRFA